MQKESNVFYCYSSKLRIFLTENNVRWFERGINQNSGYPYWAYEKTEQLGRHLAAYNKMSQK